ncbi:hypothetical protein BO223_05865 [Faecalibaculum rodentium]|uniref:Uncharacterized protein n=1 Tax=Faecalibaculum rodentium TaxID=1702221 RepID=A0A1Q9YKN7_9FIRM|nr:hypothetical protein BO223_05865 [Faecalibaculum rodentium]
MLNGLPTGDRMLYPPAGRFFILRAMDRSASQAQGIANKLPEIRTRLPGLSEIGRKTADIWQQSCQLVR